MKAKHQNAHVGSEFESYLEARDELATATGYALKRVLSWEIAEAMKKANVSRSELARRMKTSRAVVHRLLNQEDPSVTLATISRAAVALGCKVKLRIA